VIAGTLLAVPTSHEKIKNHDLFIWQVTDLLRSKYRPAQYQWESSPDVLRRLVWVLEPPQKASPSMQVQRPRSDPVWRKSSTTPDGEEWRLCKAFRLRQTDILCHPSVPRFEQSCHCWDDIEVK
jgi:hypothetical protein